MLIVIDTFSWIVLPGGIGGGGEGGGSEGEGEGDGGDGGGGHAQTSPDEGGIWFGSSARCTGSPASVRLVHAVWQ